ncbi:MAG: TfoX/Sxy family protein [Anaerolineaceae bacterium]|nr:TfoX/Sxy family protein [Anaerolineaceae bacterium]
MAYDEGMAQRIRDILEPEYPNLVEKKMFGGIAFMLQGNFACGLTKEDFVVRVGKEYDTEALAQPHTRPMDFTGKPMAGWVYVSEAGLESDEELARWVRQGVNYALSLPPK